MWPRQCEITQANGQHRQTLHAASNSGQSRNHWASMAPNAVIKHKGRNLLDT
jgi:hypothetical protein